MWYFDAASRRAVIHYNINIAFLATKTRKPFLWFSLWADCMRLPGRRVGTKKCERLLFALKSLAMGVGLCVDVCVVGIGFDKVSTRTYIFAHEHREYAVGFGYIVDGHLLEHAAFG